MLNYERQLDALIKRALKEIEKAFAVAAKDSSYLAGFVELEETSVFKIRLNQIMVRFREDLLWIFTSAVRRGWELAEDKNNVLVNTYTGKAVNATTEVLAKELLSRNRTAAEIFYEKFNREKFISDRVWEITEQTQYLINFYLASGIDKGLPASQIATGLKQYLKEPDRLFRRVRNEAGDLKLSKAAKLYNPGRGVYRSSYKNALRLARTEINASYRRADYERIQELDFVLGFEVHLSAQHPRFDICDHLVGKYPKEFIFTGWHPNCLCYTTTILQSDEEFRKSLRGEENELNYIEEIPKDAKAYLQERTSIFRGYKNPPYWLRDNFRYDERFGYIVKGTGEKIGKNPITRETGGEEMRREYPVIRMSDYEYQDYYKNKYNARVKTDWANGPNTRSIAEFFREFNNFDYESWIRDAQKLTSKYGMVINSQSMELRRSGYREGFYLSGNFNFKDPDKMIIQKSAGFSLRIEKDKYGTKSIQFKGLFLPDSIQGQGFTAEWSQALITHAIAMDIDEVWTYANADVGGYAWAKYGFEASRDFEILEVLRKAERRNGQDYFWDVVDIINGYLADQNGGDDLIEYNPDLGDDDPNRIRYIMNGVDYFPMSVLADMDGMKEILLGTNWEGRLNLKDPNILRRLKAYIYRDR